jgi:hypothetical protein
MKKVLLFVSAICSFGLSQAQTSIPNGDLEAWTVTGAYEEPDGGMLKTLNQISTFPGSPPVTTFKDGVEKHGGMYSARMVAGQIDLGLGAIFIPGVLGTVVPFFQPVIGASLGVPFTDKPNSFKGWLKYSPVQGDSAEVSAFLMKRNGASRETLAVARQRYLQPVANWTSFDAPFQYFNTTTLPDSIIIICITSAGYNFDNLTNCQGKVNSTLWIDDLSLDYTNGIEQNLFNGETVQVYPNPSSDMVTLTTTGNVTNGRVEILDMNGKLIIGQTFTGTTQTVDIRSLAAGTYIVRLSEGNRRLYSSQIVKK